MAQPGPVEESMDQEVPESVGRASVRWVPRAMPAPLLVTVMVNPMPSPAETEGSSAVLATSMAAPWTSTEALATSAPSFNVATAAVLSTGELPAVAAVVGETTWTLNVPPGARSTGPQLSAPNVIWQ